MVGNPASLPWTQLPEPHLPAIQIAGSVIGQVYIPLHSRKGELDDELSQVREHSMTVANFQRYYSELGDIINWASESTRKMDGGYPLHLERNT